MIKDSKYYTVKEVSVILKLHKNTVLKLLHNGSIKGIKIGKEWRILSADMPRVEVSK